MVPNLREKESQFKYLGCLFPEDGKFTQGEYRRRNENKVMPEIRKKRS